jgi:ankyrin repeat protein
MSRPISPTSRSNPTLPSSARAGAGGAGAGSSPALADIESRALQLSHDGEATWHSKGTQLSVAKALMQWRALYLDANDSSPTDKTKVNAAMSGFEHYVHAQNNPELTQHWQELKLTFAEPMDEFDLIGSVAGESVHIPLREVFAAVYWASVDLDAYRTSTHAEECKAEGGKTTEIDVAEKNRQDRLHTLGQSIITMHQEKVRCHLGIRNDLTGTLNGVYPGITFITDIDSYLVSTLKQAVLNELSRAEELENTAILKQWVIEKAMPDRLFEHLQRDGGIGIAAIAIQLSQACKNAGLALNDELRKKITAYVAPHSLPYLRAPTDNHPALCALAELVNYPSKNLPTKLAGALEKIKHWAAKHWRNNASSYQRIHSFLLAAKADIALTENEAVLSVWRRERLSPAQLNEAKEWLSQYLTALTTTKTAPAILSPIAQKALERLNSVALEFSHDKQTALIQNFFALHFASDTADNDTLRNLYQRIFNPSIRRQVFIDDEQLNLWLEHAHDDDTGITNIDVYDLNRLLITAIFQPIKDWSERFYYVMQDIIPFIERGCSADDHYAPLGIQLQLSHSSYPLDLVNQLKYLLQNYQIAHDRPLCSERLLEPTEGWPIFSGYVDNAPCFESLLFSCNARDLCIDDLHLNTMQSANLFASIPTDKMAITFCCLANNQSWQMIEQWLAWAEEQREDILCSLVNHCIHCNNLSSLERLTNYGADLNKVDAQGNTSLHIAAKKAKPTTCQWLIDQGVNIDVRNKKGETALIQALLSNRKKIFDLLIRQGANVQICDKHGKTAFTYALATRRHHSQHYLNDLIEKGLAPSLTDRGPLLYAKGQHPYLAGLIDALLVRQETASSLVQAVIAGDTRSVLCTLMSIPRLVNHQDSRGLSLLYHAAQQGGDMVDLLLEKGANPHLASFNGVTAIQIAAYKNHCRAVKRLYRAGANIESQSASGKTPLMSAAKSGAIQTLKYLLEAGCAINQRDHKGRTALHFAAQYHKVAAAQQLLIHGADCHCQLYQSQETPLLIAAKLGHADMVILLRQRGAKITAKNSHGLDALALAVHHRHDRVICALNTALHKTLIPTADESKVADHSSLGTAKATTGLAPTVSSAQRTRLFSCLPSPRPSTRTAAPPPPRPGR